MSHDYVALHYHLLTDNIQKSTNKDAHALVHFVRRQADRLKFPVVRVPKSSWTPLPVSVTLTELYKQSAYMFGDK